jgi:FkbM family methyltransferase
MAFDTRRLFLRLLRTLDIEVVCDAGSMDGRDALRFRRCARDADIIALEPNPANFERMQSEVSLATAGIELVQVAAAHFDGDAPFHLVPAPPGPDERGRRGMSSLLERADARFTGPSITTPVRRLDGLLGARVRDRRLALWIDTEGMAFETLAGAAGLAQSLELVHVEVEAEPCIAASQHLYPDVEALLRSWGFIELATNSSAGSVQFDAVFVRRHPDTWVWWRTRFWWLALKLHQACQAMIAAVRSRDRA